MKRTLSPSWCPQPSPSHLLLSLSFKLLHSRNYWLVPEIIGSDTWLCRNFRVGGLGIHLSCHMVIPFSCPCFSFHFISFFISFLFLKFILPPPTEPGVTTSLLLSCLCSMSSGTISEYNHCYRTNPQNTKAVS